MGDVARAAFVDHLDQDPVGHELGSQFDLPCRSGAGMAHRVGGELARDKEGILAYGMDLSQALERVPGQSRGRGVTPHSESQEFRVLTHGHAKGLPGCAWLTRLVARCEGELVDHSAHLEQAVDLRGPLGQADPPAVLLGKDVAEQDL